jgi:hypothetical protein
MARSLRPPLAAACGPTISHLTLTHGGTSEVGRGAEEGRCHHREWNERKREAARGGELDENG